jgi:hypothetical protein
MRTGYLTPLGSVLTCWLYSIWSGLDGHALELPASGQRHEKMLVAVKHYMRNDRPVGERASMLAETPSAHRQMDGTEDSLVYGVAESLLLCDSVHTYVSKLMRQPIFDAYDIPIGCRPPVRRE